MSTSFLRGIGVWLVTTVLASHAVAEIPRPIELRYKTQTSQNGIALHGSSLLRWTVEQSHPHYLQYKLESETTTPLLGTLFRSTSTGTLLQDVLTPAEFSEARLKRNPVQLRFQHDKKIAVWSDKAQAITLKAAAQDRLSMIWQLVIMMRAQAATGLSSTGQNPQIWPINLVSNRSCDTWRFQLLDRSRLRTEIGEFEVLHLARIVPGSRSAGGNKLEFWLAPSLEYYPVQMLFEDTHGLKVEQKITSIQKH